MIDDSEIIQKIEYITFTGENGYCRLSALPDKCPHCKNNITPENYGKAYKQTKNWGGYESLEIIFKCPNSTCRHLFVGYYRSPGSRSSDYYILNTTGCPAYFKPINIPESVKNISKKFPTIYQQAIDAQDIGLNEISGPGLGKALEFLTKDYLIHVFPDRSEEIKQKWLGDAIKEIPDETIKSLAEKAAWLRNDESHYLKRFQDMDAKHLQDLISIIINFIDNSERAKKYLKLPKKLH